MVAVIDVTPAFRWGGGVHPEEDSDERAHA
jgi:hypothetical protein